MFAVHVSRRLAAGLWFWSRGSSRSHPSPRQGLLAGPYVVTTPGIPEPAPRALPGLRHRWQPPRSLSDLFRRRIGAAAGVLAGRAYGGFPASGAFILARTYSTSASFASIHGGVATSAARMIWLTIAPVPFS